MFSWIKLLVSCDEFRRPSALISVLFAQIAFAGIDSGGGRASVGTSSILVSVGEPFATTPSVAGSSQIFPGQIEVLYQLSTPTDLDSNRGEFMMGRRGADGDFSFCCKVLADRRERMM